MEEKWEIWAILEGQHDSFDHSILENFALILGKGKLEVSKRSVQQYFQGIS